MKHVIMGLDINLSKHLRVEGRHFQQHGRNRAEFNISSNLLAMLCLSVGVHCEDHTSAYQDNAELINIDQITISLKLVQHDALETRTINLYQLGHIRQTDTFYLTNTQTLLEYIDYKCINRYFSSLSLKWSMQTRTMIDWV